MESSCEGLWIKFTNSTVQSSSVQYRRYQETDPLGLEGEELSTYSTVVLVPRDKFIILDISCKWGLTCGRVVVVDIMLKANRVDTVLLLRLRPTGA